MENAGLYTLDQAHNHFAKTLNGKVWELLEKPGRSKPEDDLMLYAAHASCYHWLEVGTGLHHQRGEWLIAHVSTVLGFEEAALRHARRCLELTQEYAELMQDFDWAYAYEGLARANALAGNHGETVRYLQLALEHGQSIANDEDQKIFMGDFEGGEWYGMK